MNKFILFFSVMCFQQFAFANEDMGLFVEPSISYETSKFKVDYPGASSDGTTNGLGLGARFGFHVSEVLFFGLDARYSMLKMADKNSIFNYNATGSAYNWGPVAGAQMPTIGLRVWAAYVVDGQYNPDADGALDFRFKKGQGFRIGTGFRLGMVSLNLEYQDLKYKSSILEQAGPFAPGTSFDNVQLTNQSWLASVSFPIEI